MKVRLHFVLMYVAAIFSSHVAAGTNNTVPTLLIYGTVQHSVCTPDNLKALKRSLESLQIKRQWLLWRAIHTMGCGKVHSLNTKFVASVIAPKIQITVDGTGQSPSDETIKRSNISVDDLFATGKAYDASVSKMENGIQLSYWPNEVCVVHRNFQYISGKWWLVSIGEACD